MIVSYHFSTSKTAFKVMKLDFQRPPRHLVSRWNINMRYKRSKKIIERLKIVKDCERPPKHLVSRWNINIRYKRQNKIGEQSHQRLWKVVKDHLNILWADKIWIWDISNRKVGERCWLKIFKDCERPPQHLVSRLHQIKSELCIRSSPCSPSSNHYFDDFDDRGDDFDDGDNDGADGWRAGHVLW